LEGFFSLITKVGCTFSFRTKIRLVMFMFWLVSEFTEGT